MLRSLLLVSCLFAALEVSAQSVMISDPLSLRNDYGYEIIGRLRDRILIFRDRYESFEIQAFDNLMHLAWNKEVEDIERRGTEVLGVYAGKNDFSIIFQTKRRGSTYLRVHKYDPGATLIDSMLIKNYGERLFNPPDIELVRSEDRNCIIAYNKADRDNVEMTCFQLDKMQVLWDKIAKFNENSEAQTNKSMAISNEGDLYLVSEYNNRKGRLDEHELHILHVNAASESVRRVPLHDFLVQDVKFAYDNMHHCFIGAGLYGDRSSNRSNGVFYLRDYCNNGADTNLVVKHTPFDDQFLSILKQKDVNNEAKGVSDADVSQLLLRQDGGVVLVAERHYELQRGSLPGRTGMLRDGGRLVVDFYFDDVFAIALNPDGAVHWKTVLHKKQYSQDDEGTFSSYYLFKNADRLHFLFNDEIKYENTCSEYVLSPTGGFDRNSLLNTFGQGLRLRYRDALQISLSECLVPSEYRNKLRMVLIRF